MNPLVDFSPDVHLVYDALLNAKHISKDYASMVQYKPLGENKINSHSLEAKIKGALIGGAIGDALGRPLEGINPDPKSIWIEHFQAPKDYIRGPIGVVTDDTQLTIWLAESIAKHRGIYPAQVAVEFSDHYIRNMSNSIREFMRNMNRGDSEWYEVGVQSSDSSVAVRSAPIGIFYRDNLPALVKASILQSYITHHDDLALVSGIVVAYTVAKLLRLKPLDLMRLENKLIFLHEIADLIEGLENEYKTSNSDLTSSLYQRIKVQIPHFLTQEYPIEWVHKDFLSQEYVLESLPYALFLFLFTPTDFTQSIQNAINCSIDSDSVGALVGTFSGALNGIESIDHYYLENIEFKEELLFLGEQLFKHPYQS